MTALTDLLAALESGTAGGLPYETWLFACGMPDDVDNAKMADQGNTQAAIDFAEAALPGWYWSMSQSRSGYGTTVWNEGRSPMPIHTATGPTPARALTIAVIKALVAKEAGE